MKGVVNMGSHKTHGPTGGLYSPYPYIGIKRETTYNTQSNFGIYRPSNQNLSINVGIVVNSNSFEKVSVTMVTECVRNCIRVVEIQNFLPVGYNECMFKFYTYISHGLPSYRLDQEAFNIVKNDNNCDYLSFIIIVDTNGADINTMTLVNTQGKEKSIRIPCIHLRSKAVCNSNNIKLLSTAIDKEIFKGEQLTSPNDKKIEIWHEKIKILLRCLPDIDKIGQKSEAEINNETSLSQAMRALWTIPSENMLHVIAHELCHVLDTYTNGMNRAPYGYFSPDLQYHWNNKRDHLSFSRAIMLSEYKDKSARNPNSNLSIFNNIERLWIELSMPLNWKEKRFEIPI